MLKTTGNTGSIIDIEETKGKAGSNNVVDDSVVSGDEVTNQTNSIKRKNQVKTIKSKILVKSKNHDFPPNSRNKEAGTGFFTPEARLAFTQLRQAFIEALILHHFDPKRHIRIETDMSGYAIGRILNHLNSDDSGQWHPLAFFSRKMILAET